MRYPKRMQSGSLAALAGIICGAAVLSAASGAVVLNENAYCRAHYQFGWDWVDAKTLKAEGERHLGAKGLKRLEGDVKRRLAYRKLDWSKEDWRDHAVTRYVVISHGLSKSEEMERACHVLPPPPGWSEPDFDDSAWMRFIKPFAVGATTGMYFSQWSTPTPGLEVAYLRYRFGVPDPGKVQQLLLRAEYVGGVRVLVNGKEVARGHLTARGGREDAVTPQTRAEGYPLEAYLMPFKELTGRDLDRAKRKLKGKAPPKHWGYAGWNVRPGSQVYKARNRSVGPVAVPPRLLRAGANVLAIEVHAAPLHPKVVYEHAWYGGFGKPSAWPHAVLNRLELRAPGAAVPSAVQRPAGVQVWAADMHRRVYSPEYLECGADAGSIRMVGARNGTYAAQVVVGTDRELKGVKIGFEGLSGPGGRALPAGAVRAFGMARYAARQGFGRFGEGRIGGNCFFTLGGYRSLAQYNAYVRFVQPTGEKKAWDRVFLYDQITRSLPETIPADSCQPFWVRVRVPADAGAGVYRGAVRVQADGVQPASVPLELEVVDWSLPEPRHFQAVTAVEQSPYGVAKAYKVPLWSDEHFRYLEASVRELGRIGNDWWYVPVIHHTEFGNRDDSMIRWIRRADGSLEFDFGILDRYLDLIVKHCGRPRVVSFVVMHGAPGPVEVTVLDAGTGKGEPVSLGGRKFDPAVRRRYWHALAKALYAHMKGYPKRGTSRLGPPARGLGEAMHWGYAWDTEGDPKLKELLRGCVPDVYWTFGAHSRWASGSGGRMARSSLEFYKSTSNIYGPVPGLTSRKGWKQPNVNLLNPRVLSSCSSTEGHAPPFNFRMMLDRALVAGFNGLGRLGGDYWGSYYDGARVGAYHQASFSVLRNPA